jgi:hypothetical protein
MAILVAMTSCELLTHALLCFAVLGVQNDVVPLEGEGGAEGGDPSSSGAAAAVAAAAAAAAAAGMPADLGAVPQIPPGMYYGAPPGMGQYQQAVMPAAAAGPMGAVPDMQGAGPAMPLAEPPVAAVMFEQWANEGQLQAAQQQAPQQ